MKKLSTLSLLIPSLLLIGVSASLFAGSKPPPKRKASAEHEIKKDLNEANKAANEALNAVDKGVHKVIGSANEAVSKDKKK